MRLDRVGKVKIKDEYFRVIVISIGVVFIEFYC